MSSVAVVFGGALLGGTLGAAVSSSSAMLLDARRRSHEQHEVLRQRRIALADSFVSEAALLQRAVTRLAAVATGCADVDDLVVTMRSSNLDAKTMDWIVTEMRKSAWRSNGSLEDARNVVDAHERKISELLGPLQLHFGLWSVGIAHGLLTSATQVSAVVTATSVATTGRPPSEPLPERSRRGLESCHELSRDMDDAIMRFCEHARDAFSPGGQGDPVVGTSSTSS